MPENVRVSTEALKTLARNLATIADELGPVATKTEMITVVPGAFPAGEKYKTTAHTHRDKVLANVVNLKGALEEISRNLLLVANEYDRGEDVNGMEAEKLKSLLRSLNRWLPGAVPQDDGLPKLP